MISMLVIAATLGAADGLGAGSTGLYSPARDPRPIAGVPAAQVNGRLFVSRPIIGPQPGPSVVHTGVPGAEYYGAVNASDARVPARVGHLVVTISPWEGIEQPGLRRFEEARQFWLHENNYTGGVRTFINDLHLWEPPRRGHVDGAGVETIRGVPEPRATIQLNPDAPRQRRPLRVDRGEQPARISWPHVAPVQIVDRSAVPHTVAAGN
jgi:hypothetical protein